MTRNTSTARRSGSEARSVDAPVMPGRDSPTQPTPAHAASVLVDVLARALGAVAILGALAFAFMGWAGMLW